jgi:protease I
MMSGTGCFILTDFPRKETAMTLQGRRIVIFAERQYEDLELWYPKLRLQEAGAEVIVAGTGERVYMSKHGYPVTTDVSAADLRAEDFDGVLVPGGWAPDYLRRHAAVTSFVRAMDEAGKLVAAICHGGSVLVSAGILEGRELTSVVAIRDDLVNAGAVWVDDPVVVDGNLVTSRRPADLDSFLPAIIAVLEEQGHVEHGVSLAVDAQVVSVGLDDASFVYMVEMLDRMPSARAYTDAEFDPAHDDPVRILSDFARGSDPRGPLEAEAVVVIDVRPLGNGRYVARGNVRLLSVVDGASVPGLVRVGR